MLTKEHILEILRAHHTYLVSEYGVKRIGIFGSYAKREQHDTSDVDVIAEFARPLGLKFVEFTDILPDFRHFLKSCLNKMSVECKSHLNVTLFHDKKGETVCQRVGFIIMLYKILPCLIKQRLINMNQSH
jgi:predicted nucleotidyltransferase